MKKLFITLISACFIFSVYADTLSVPVSALTGNVATQRCGSSVYGLFRNFKGQVYIAAHSSETKQWNNIISLPEYSQNYLFWEPAVDQNGNVVQDKAIFVYQGVEYINVLGLNYSAKTSTQLASLPLVEGEIEPSISMYDGNLYISMGGSEQVGSDEPSESTNSTGWTVDYTPFLKYAPKTENK